MGNIHHGINVDPGRLVKNAQSLGLPSLSNAKLKTPGNAFSINATMANANDPRRKGDTHPDISPIASKNLSARSVIDHISPGPAD